MAASAPLAKTIVLTALLAPAIGQAIVNEPTLTLAISLTDTTGALGVATSSGNFTLQTTKILTSFDNPALGAAACPRKVVLSGSVRITSTTTIPEDEF